MHATIELADHCNQCQEFLIWPSSTLDTERLHYTYTVLDLILIIYFLGLVAVHLDTQVVSTLLPMHLAVCYIEQVTHTQLISARNLYQCDSGGSVGLLGDPVCYNVVGGRPGEIPVNMHVQYFVLPGRTQNPCE